MTCVMEGTEGKDIGDIAARSAILLPGHPAALFRREAELLLWVQESEIR